MFLLFLLQIMSNGRFKAVTHQVATNADMDRLSIGIFMTSILGQKDVKPENAFLSDETPPKYKAYSFEEYTKFFEMKITEVGSEISFAEASKFALDSFLIK